MRQLIFSMTMAIALLLPTIAHTDDCPDCGYRGEKGKIAPADWPGLCQGGEQSPINITHSASSGEAAEPIEFHYKPARSEVIDDGKAIVVEEVAGTVTVARATYELCELHFHTPSEHTVANIGTAAEVHFVHQTSCDDDKSEILVIGALIAPASPGRPPNATLGKYLKGLGYLPAKTPKLNPGDILPEHGYYQYSGSLTTPDCRTGVIWFVAQEPLYLPNQDLIRLGAYYLNNARPGQSLGSRKLRGMR